MSTQASPDPEAPHARKAKRPSGSKPAKATKAAKTSQPAATGAVTLRWNLHELPSSQHKAGLAGLALWLRFLKRVQVGGVCELVAVDDSSLEMRVDRDGMQSLFDLVYRADSEERALDKKWQKKLADGTKVDVEPRRVESRTETDKKGNTREKPVYIYPQTVPHGGLVADWDEGPDKRWLKLWRDFVWSVLRGVPATREPYDARAENRPVEDGRDAWDELVYEPNEAGDLPSTYYLGAQAKSAEYVSFRDINRSRFLLHFWPFAVPIYVPVSIDRKGDTDFAGFALVVPDVMDLAGFVDNWENLMRGRGHEVAGYRPREAVIDVAAEAGLDVSARVFDLIGTGQAETPPWMGAVDVFHLEKDGNNVRLRGAARVVVRRDYAREYRNARQAYWSPVFRRQVILNILEGRSRWHGFGRLCSTLPRESTIENYRFQHDCREAFKEEPAMSESESEAPASLEVLIYRIVRSYVGGRLGSKYDLKWSGDSSESEKSEYNNRKDKIARAAFLAVRSRTGADFVAYFTGTLCSVSQRLGQQGFLTVAAGLRDDVEIEHIRTLTLLALSAA